MIVVMSAMASFAASVGANPGRSGHTLSIEAARIILDAREAAAALFSVPDMLRIAFTKNATEALNIAIHGHNPVLSEIIVDVARTMDEEARQAGASVIAPMLAVDTSRVYLASTPCV